MTRQEFLPVVALLCAALDREMAPAQVEAWYRILETLPAAAVEIAVLRHLRQSPDSFLPAPGRIAQLASEAMHGIADTPETAYGTLCRVRRERGATIHRGEFQARQHLSERLWTLAESVGGWARFCDATTAERGIEFAQVRDAWTRMTERESTALALPAALQPRLRTDAPIPAGTRRLEGAR